MWVIYETVINYFLTVIKMLHTSLFNLYIVEVFYKNLKYKNYWGEIIMLKKSLALIMALALVCSLCACGNTSKTTYLTLAKEMQMIEGQEVKGSVSVDVSGLLDELDSDDLAKEYDISKLELTYTGECDKVNSDLDVALKLGKLGEINIDYVSKEDELYIHKDLVTDVLDMIVDVAKESGESDAMTEAMIDEFEKSFDDILTEDYILIDVSELAEDSGVSMDLDMSKISFTNTIDKLNVFLQLYNSNMLTKTKEGYSIEFSKEKIESDIENLKKAIAKDPEKFLQSMVDVTDALDSDLSNISKDLKDNDTLVGLRETSDEIKEMLEDKEGMKELKKKLKDKEEMKEFEEIFSDLEDLDGFVLKSTISKEKETYISTCELTFDSEDVKGLSFKLEQTVTPKDVSISAPKSSISIEDLLESTGLAGSMSMGESSWSGNISTPGYDFEEEEEDEEEYFVIEEDEEKEIKKQDKKDKKPTSSKSGVLLGYLSTMTDIDDCEDILEDINSALDGNYVETYRNDKSDYISISHDYEVDDDLTAISKLMLMDGNYASYSYTVRFDGTADKDEATELFYNGLKTLLGKDLDLANEDLEDLVENIVNGKSKDKNFTVDIGDLECSFYGHFSDDEEPEYQYYSLSLEVSYSNN